MDYHIQPTDSKHPVVLPIDHEAEYKVKNGKMFLKVPDGDHKTRTYQVVAMEPAKQDSSAQNNSANKSPDNSAWRLAAGGSLALTASAIDR